MCCLRSPTPTLDTGRGSWQKSNEWVVCGLVSASRFRYDVFAVSTSVVLIAIAIVLLALCCWPYLRIALIHPSQPLTITDVVLIIICTIVGAAVHHAGAARCIRLSRHYANRRRTTRELQSTP